MPNKKVEKKSNVGTTVAVSAGIAALGVVGYLLMGPNGKKNRKEVKSWMLKMKGEILEKMEAAKEVTAPMYEKIVDEIGAKYKALKHIDPMELAGELATIKKSWKDMSTKAKAKKVVKKAVVKTAAKAASTVKKVAKATPKKK